MSDPVAGLTDEDAASVPAPSPTSEDIDKMIETRIAGFQRLLAQRDELLEARTLELEELKTAALPEDERAQHLESKKDREISELRAKLELNELAGDYGTEMPFFKELLAGSSAKEQLEVMRKYAATFKPVAPSTDEEDSSVEVPDIDSNRPARRAVQGTLLQDGTVMTDAIADQILGSFPNAVAARSR